MRITKLKPPEQQEKILQAVLKKKQAELQTTQAKMCAHSKVISELVVDINGIEGHWSSSSFK
eukprot:3417866-Karenia_brevis.AAC.1